MFCAFLCGWRNKKITPRKITDAFLNELYFLLTISARQTRFFPQNEFPARRTKKGRRRRWPEFFRILKECFQDLSRRKKAKANLFRFALRRGFGCSTFGRPDRAGVQKKLELKRFHLSFLIGVLLQAPTLTMFKDENIKKDLI